MQIRLKTQQTEAHCGYLFDQTGHARSSRTAHVTANPQEAPQLSSTGHEGAHHQPRVCDASCISDRNQEAATAVIKAEYANHVTHDTTCILSAPGLRIGLAVSLYGQSVCVAFSPSWHGFCMVLVVVMALLCASFPAFCGMICSAADKPSGSETEAEQYFEIDDHKQGAFPCLRKTSRRGVCRKSVSFSEVVTQLDLESFEDPVLIPISSPSQDTRMTYTMAACKAGLITRVAPKTYYGQEDRWLTDSFARYDPEEPEALREMVESGVYNAWELATAYRKAAAGAHPTDEDAKLVRQIYWRQYTQVLRPLLDRHF